MSKLVSCGRCQRQLSVPQEKFGRDVTCDECGATIAVAHDREPVADETPDPSTSSRQTAAETPAGARPAAPNGGTKKTVLTASGEEAILIKCPDCGKKLGVEASWLGKQVRCTRCTKTFVAKGAGPRSTAKPTILRPGSGQKRGAAPEANIPLEKPELVPQENLPPAPAVDYNPAGSNPAGSNPDLNGLLSPLRNPEAPPEPAPLPSAKSSGSRTPIPSPKPRAPGKFTTLQQEHRQAAQEEIGKGFPPLKFPVVVQDDPEGQLYGKLAARMTQEGLYLKLGRQTEFLVPVGSPAEHLEANSFTIVIAPPGQHLEGRRVKLAVVKWHANRERLARDVVALLNGERKWLMAASYSLPWSLLLTPLLPLGIPLLALPRYIAEGNVLLGAASMGLAVALSAICLWLAQQETWPVAKRLRIALGAVVGGYLVVLLSLYVRPGPPDPPVWATETSANGNFTVNLPRHPQDTPQENTNEKYSLPSGLVKSHELAVPLRQPRLRFAVSYFDLPPGQATPQFFDELPKAFYTEFPGGEIESCRDISPLDGCHLGKDYRLVNLEGGEKAHRRVYLVRSRVYFLTAKGDLAATIEPNGEETYLKKFLEEGGFQLIKPKLLEPVRLDAVIYPFLAAAAHPPSRKVFTLNGEALNNFKILDYGKFELSQEDFTLDKSKKGYQTVLDPDNGLLYVAVADKIETQRWGGRGRSLGQGPIHVYDVSKALKGPGAELDKGRPAPLAVVPVNAKVASLFLSPDRNKLYFLDVSEINAAQGYWVDVSGRGKWRLGQELQAEPLGVSFAPGTEAMALNPEGTTLFSIAAEKRHNRLKAFASPGLVQVTPLANPEDSKKIELEVEPVDVAVTRKGYAFVTSEGTDILVVSLELQKHDPERRGWKPCARGVPSGCYLRLSPDLRRLYLADQEAVYPWLIDEPYVQGLDPGERVKGTVKVSGPLFVSPDGRYLLCPTGAVFKAVGDN